MPRAKNTCQWRLLGEIDVSCGRRCVDEYCARHAYYLRKGSINERCERCGKGVKTRLRLCEPCGASKLYRDLRRNASELGCTIEELLEQIRRDLLVVASEPAQIRDQPAELAQEQTAEESPPTPF